MNVFLLSKVLVTSNIQEAMVWSQHDKKIVDSDVQRQIKRNKKFCFYTVGILKYVIKYFYI